MKKNLNLKESRLAYDEEAKKLVKELTLEEKVYLMSGNIFLQDMIDSMSRGEHYNEKPYYAGGIERLDIPAVRFVDGPRGAVTGVGKTTCFPVSMARGASFDKDLEYRIGQAIGKEIRATGGNFFGGVCINLPYNPGWGRSQEVYGEDSYHLGQMGSSLANGVQSEDVIACAKHYAFNSMENKRFEVNVTADKRTEREVYINHFKEVVDNGCAAVMTSYNKYMGDYCGENHYLITDVLQDEWGFDGFLVSDFVNGIHDTEKAANAGLTIEMNNTRVYGDNLIKAVKDGKVKEEVIDDAAIRIIRTVLAFENNYDKNYGEEVLASEEHVNLAREAAEKSITLIKNDNNNLPLNKSNIERLAVIGKLADKGNTGDYGSSRVYPPYVISPLEGIQKEASGIEVIYSDGSSIEEAKELAKNVDAVIFVVGYDHDDEGEYVGGDFYDVDGDSKSHNDEVELKDQMAAGAVFEAVGGDRINSLGLHEDEIKLINEVSKENANNVVVLVGGNMIMIDDFKDNVSSIIMSYYSGMEGGTALANIIFGKVNPSGKLPFVIPHKETDLPIVDWTTTEIKYDYYHGYAKLDKEGIEPSVPYGFGMSYTKFEYSDEIFKVDDKNIISEVKVKNVGDLYGEEVVELYVGFKNSKLDRPIKSLKGFTRVSLEPAEEKVVQIETPIEKLSFYNDESGKYEIEDMEYEIYIGSSSSERDLLCGKIDLRR